MGFVSKRGEGVRSRNKKERSSCSSNVCIFEKIQDELFFFLDDNIFKKVRTK